MIGQNSAELQWCGKNVKVFCHNLQIMTTYNSRDRNFLECLFIAFFFFLVTIFGETKKVEMT